MTRRAKTPRPWPAADSAPRFSRGPCGRNRLPRRTSLAPGFRHASVPPCLRLSEGVLRMAMRVLGGNDGFRPLPFRRPPPRSPRPAQRVCAGHSPGHGGSPPETRRIPTRNTARSAGGGRSAILRVGHGRGLWWTGGGGRGILGVNLACGVGRVMPRQCDEKWLFVCRCGVPPGGRGVGGDDAQPTV